MLLESGAHAVINKRNSAGNLPLHCYVKRYWGWLATMPSKTGLNLLLNYGADRDLHGADGLTARDYLATTEQTISSSAETRRLEMLKIL